MQNMQNILRNNLRASRLCRTTPTRYPPSSEGGILVTPILVGWAGAAFLYWIDFKGIRTMHKAMAASRENLKRNLEILEEERARRLKMLKTEEAQQQARKWEEARAILREWEIKMNAEEAKQRARVASDDNVDGFWINDDNVGPKDDCQFAM